MAPGNISKVTRCAINIGALRQPAFPRTIQGMRQRLIGRKRQSNPYSARPRLFSLPNRLSDKRRKALLAEIERRCAKNDLGCWLFPALRDGFPYVDVVNDKGEREQWAGRRFVWVLANGPIPDRGILLGACPFTACVLTGHQALWVPPLQLDWVGI